MQRANTGEAAWGSHSSPCTHSASVCAATIGLRCLLPRSRRCPGRAPAPPHSSSVEPPGARHPGKAYPSPPPGTYRADSRPGHRAPGTRRLRGAEPASCCPASRLVALPARPPARPPSPRLSAPSTQPCAAAGLGGQPGRAQVTYTSMPTPPRRLRPSANQEPRSRRPRHTPGRRLPAPRCTPGSPRCTPGVGRAGARGRGDARPSLRAAPVPALRPAGFSVTRVCRPDWAYVYGLGYTQIFRN